MLRELIFSFTKKDFRIEYFRGSGPGGQHKNKRDTACRITHIESGLSCSCQEHKSQKQNKKAAFIKLCDKLVNHYIKQENKGRYAAPQETTRTYHELDDRVVDHVTGDKFSYRHTVGKCDITEIIEARVKNWPRE